MFILFMLAVFATQLVFLFIGNFTVNLMNDHLKYDTSDRTYIVHVDGSYRMEQGREFLESWGDSLEHVYAALLQNGEYITADLYGSFPGKFGISYGRDFTEIEKSEGAAVILLPNDAYLYDDETPLEDIRKYTIGDTYPLLGRDYLIIGIGMEDYFQIPYQSLSSCPEAVLNMVIVTNNHMNDKDTFVQSLKQIFGTDQIRVSRSSAALPKGYVVDLIVIIALLSIGIVNFVFLYQTVLELRKNQLLVFRLCGCSGIRVFLQCIGEVLILYSACFLLAVPVVKLILAWAEIYNYMYADACTFGICVLIYFICLLIFSAFFVFPIRKMLRGTLSQIRNLTM
ncbi:MAG: hypothetical protein IJK71_03475 [Clostridia bacterium]|nr:hypothetical protein [Clostridia bacterium]